MSGGTTARKCEFHCAIQGAVAIKQHFHTVAENLEGAFVEWQCGPFRRGDAVFHFWATLIEHSHRLNDAVVLDRYILSNSEFRYPGQIPEVARWARTLNDKINIGIRTRGTASMRTNESNRHNVDVVLCPQSYRFNKFVGCHSVLRTRSKPVRQER